MPWQTWAYKEATPICFDDLKGTDKRRIEQGPQILHYAIENVF